MLLEGPAGDALRNLLDEMVRQKRIVTPKGNDPATLLGEAARYPDVVAQWNALFARVGAPVADAPLDEVQAVAHRARSEVPGTSNTGADAWGGTRLGSSANWAGALIAAPNGGRYTGVSARWRVPPADAIRLPPGAAPNAAPSPVVDSYKASIWIGLDGHRSTSGSLPQIGTTLALDHKKGDPACIDGTEFVLKTYAWVQWWVKGKDSQPGYIEVPVPGFEVKPGETVTCWLSMPRPHEAFFRIVNEDSGALWQKLWTNSPEDLASIGTAVNRLDAPVDGSAACFVVERPAVHRDPATQPVAPLASLPNVLYPLPDFGTVEFTNCWALERRFGRQDIAAARVRDLGARRLIRMFDRRTDPHRTEFRVVPKTGTARDRLIVNYRAGMP